MRDHKQRLLFLCYVLSLKVIVTNSRTSTLWKLNAEHTKIIEASPFDQIGSGIEGVNKPPQNLMVEDDPVFNIITSTVRFGKLWIKQGIKYYCTECMDKDLLTRESIKNNSDSTVVEQQVEVLDCGKPINFTYFDNLVGIMNRHEHPNIPESQISLIFPNKNKRNPRPTEQEIDTLERRLKKAKKEKPKSVALYNQIGNFWRIKGDSLKSIECFRKALAVSPHNAEVLMNLGRVLYNLQYLDDAIFLTRRSLEVQPPDKGAWIQYFTLGEIFKAYGRYQEATVHMRHALELRPGFEPALIALKEMESSPPTSIHIYTLVIIIFLVIGVLLVILVSVDNMMEGEGNDGKPQRHFNKAMAMRSLRGFGVSQRNLRMKKI